MIRRNYLDYHCSYLTPGAGLCIGDTCTVYSVKANDTCQGIVQGQSFGLVQLIGWNPTLHDNCDNLDSMVGRSLCISPPGGDGPFTLPTPSTTTIQGLSSSLVSSWVPGETITKRTNMSISWYYPTIEPEYTPPIKTLTPNATYTSLLAERTQYCWITEEEFNEDFDPFEFDDYCYSLYEDYCEPAITDPVLTSRDIPASCTPAFTTEPEGTAMSTSKSTTTETITTAPTQPNMVDGCTEFHQVESQDECGTIASKYDISLKVFCTWDSDVSEKCNAL